MKKLTFFLVLVTLVSSGAAYYFYSQLHQNGANSQASQEEVKSLIAQVSQLIVLPTDETPTIATVSDPERLKDQPFFAKAQKGDKVLIYSGAGKAFLYRPSTKKLVDVAPINIGKSP